MAGEDMEEEKIVSMQNDVNFLTHEEADRLFAHCNEWGRSLPSRVLRPSTDTLPARFDLSPNEPIVRLVTEKLGIGERVGPIVAYSNKSDKYILDKDTSYIVTVLDARKNPRALRVWFKRNEHVTIPLEHGSMVTLSGNGTCYYGTRYHAPDFVGGLGFSVEFETV
jgi:hypothetical protein